MDAPHKRTQPDDDRTPEQREREQREIARALLRAAQGKPPQFLRDTYRASSHIGPRDKEGVARMRHLEEALQDAEQRLDKIKARIAAAKQERLRRAPPEYYDERGVYQARPVRPACGTCNGTGVLPETRVEYRGPDIHYVHDPCPTCTPLRRQARLDDLFPVRDKVRALRDVKLQPVRGEGFDMLRRALLGLRRWPEGGAFLVIAALDNPAYGTGKTHALQWLDREARKAGKVVVYTTAGDLALRLTTFETHDAEGRELPGAVHYRQVLEDLSHVEVLLLDEATRYTPGGWTDDKIAFDVVDAAIQRGGWVVLATNTLDDLHPGLRDRAEDHAAGGQLIDLSDVRSFRRRPDQPDTAPWMLPPEPRR